jgi:hypothetical protein
MELLYLAINPKRIVNELFHYLLCNFNPSDRLKSMHCAI